MACEENIPKLGCCGGTITPSRMTQATLVANYRPSGFAPSPVCGSGWSFFKTLKRHIESIQEPEKFYIETSTINPVTGQSSVSVEEGEPGFVHEIPNNYVRDVDYEPGGFVSSGRFRHPDSDPEDPASWIWRVTIEHSDPYSYEDALEDFMTLFNIVDVLDPQFDLCRSWAWNVSYDPDGGVNTRGSATIWPGLGCYLTAGQPGGPTADRQGWYVGKAGFTFRIDTNLDANAPFTHYDDMGCGVQALFVGAKARVRMDKPACVWRYTNPSEWVWDSDPFVKRCADTKATGLPAYGGAPACNGPSCQFVPLPNPAPSDPDCRSPIFPNPLTPWPEYHEFAVFPDGVDPETGLGDPTSGIWYEWAACTQC